MTPHFKASEFLCSHCGKSGIDPAVPQALEKLRTLIGDKPIHVNSGYRCAKHPVEAAKAKPGWHTKGLAADISVRGMTARELYAAAQGVPEFHGFGVDPENDYLHVDVRPGQLAKWCYRGGHEVPWFEV